MRGRASTHTSGEKSCSTSTRLSAEPGSAEPSIIFDYQTFYVNLSSLMENYAIRRLQEQFITQVAAQVLFEEGVKYMEQEMDEIGGGQKL